MSLRMKIGNTTTGLFFTFAIIDLQLIHFNLQYTWEMDGWIDGYIYIIFPIDELCVYFAIFCEIFFPISFNCYLVACASFFYYYFFSFTNKYIHFMNLSSSISFPIWKIFVKTFRFTWIRNVWMDRSNNI